MVAMRTEQQITAARLNGKKSRGPMTAMGKDRIRSNALKHGLTARLTLWSNEDSDQFQSLLLVLLEQLAPTNDLEFLCVEEMAVAKWRMRRVVSLETAAGNRHLEAATSPGSAQGTQGALDAFTAAQQAGQLLTTFRQHEAAYARAYQRAYRHLLQLREMAPSPGPGGSTAAENSAA